jgi:hypothetical protein
MPNTKVSNALKGSSSKAGFAKDGRIRETTRIIQKDVTPRIVAATQ